MLAPLVVKKVIKMKTTHEGIEIDFDTQVELLDSVDCYDKTYLAIGYDDNGNKYTASAVYSCGELLELEDIEPSL